MTLVTDPALKEAFARFLLALPTKESSVMSNEDRPILYDFCIAVDKIDTSIVRIRDDMRRGWDVIEKRAVQLVEEDAHHPYSHQQDTEVRASGSWLASETEQQRGPFQMLEGHCRECFGGLEEDRRDAGFEFCATCDGKGRTVPEEPGLYAKYLVFKNDGDPIKNLVGDCFVLRPTTDTAAYDALWTYVEQIENDPDKKQLADDLRTWLYQIAGRARENRVQEGLDQEKQG